MRRFRLCLMRLINEGPSNGFQIKEMNITGFAICLTNEGVSVSLELHKVYPVVAEHPNDPAGYIRVIDESSEDYLFPADWFESCLSGGGSILRTLRKASRPLR